MANNLNEIFKAVYLDYNATTPLSSAVIDSIKTALTFAWGNPSSSYAKGINARRTIEKARSQVANCINAASNDIIFTSGGSESNNWVIDAAVKKFKSKTPEPILKPHIITSTVEHDSISITLSVLQKEGIIDLTSIPINSETCTICPREVVSAIKPNTCLITIMMANNETGVIMPIKEIALAAREKGKDQAARFFIHTDAAQTIGKIHVDVKDLNVDFLTIVGHKFYGPRIGALYIKDLNEGAMDFRPFIFGGGQERGWRAGTENTPMIAGLGSAAEEITENLSHFQDSMRETRDYLEKRLVEEFGEKQLHFNCKFSQRLPNTCNISFLGQGLEGYKILQKAKQFHCSTGSACHSESCKPSNILLSFHIPHDVAANALRFSTGRNTSKGDIDVVITELKSIVKSLCVGSK